MSGPPGAPDPAAVHRAYIARLNAHRMRGLEEFVADRLIYDDAPMTRRDYEDLPTGDVAAIPDLFFDVRSVVVEGERLAARIHFAVTPVAVWHGRPPDGRRVRFDEHASYRLEQGRIAEVHSVISAPEEDEPDGT